MGINDAIAGVSRKKLVLVNLILIHFPIQNTFYLMLVLMKNRRLFEKR